MKIAFGCDHGGLELKQFLLEKLKEAGYETEDMGTYTKDSCDYPIFARKVARAVAEGEADRGVLVCTSGIGMSIAANKIRGCRAALIHELHGAEFCRRHNDANVICFGQTAVEPETALECAEMFLKTGFEGGRHARRVNEFED